MKRISYISVFVVLLFGVILGQTSEPTAWTSWYEYLQFYKTGATTLTNKTLTSPTIDGIATMDSVAVDSLNVSGQLVVSGTSAFTGSLGHTETPAAGANVGSTFRTNLDTVAYTGTTGYKFKVYDTGTATVHNGGEHAVVYANMKQLSAMTNGGKSVLYSGHNYGTGGDYQIIDAADWRYGNFVDGYKISGGSIDTGLDLSETAVTGQDIELHNGATINNVHADTLSLDETVVNIGGALSIGTNPTMTITAIDTVGAGGKWVKLTIAGVDFYAIADTSAIP